MALQGTLDTFALPDVLRLLAATKKTGRLRITGGRGTGSVWVAAGEVAAVEATHAPHASEPVDALFELLRFEEGSFTFDAEAVHDAPGQPTEVEGLLAESEALLAEWRAIETVVPSLDAWVSLRRLLPQAEVTVAQEQWTTLVAIGAGATVRRVGDELCLAELPISRAVKDLVEAGLVDIEDAPPAGAATISATAPLARPLVAPTVAEVEPVAPLAPLAPAEPEAAPTGPRARRRGTSKVAEARDEPEFFVPLDLPGGTTASYDPIEEPEDERDDAEAELDGAAAAADDAVDDLAAAFPGLASRIATPATEEDEEIAKQLATLSPRAASAIRAAAEATTDEERDAALDAAEGDEQPLNRGLLLKFLSSVKS